MTDERCARTGARNKTLPSLPLTRRAVYSIHNKGHGKIVVGVRQTGYLRRVFCLDPNLSKKKIGPQQSSPAIQPALIFLKIMKTDDIMVASPQITSMSF